MKIDDDGVEVFAVCGAGAGFGRGAGVGGGSVKVERDRAGGCGECGGDGNLECVWRGGGGTSG
jgi:hypothetical protein